MILFQQLKSIWKRNSFWAVMFVLMAIIMYNYWENLDKFYGLDVLEIWNPADMLTLGKMGMQGLWYVSLFPVLVTLPSAFIYLKDEESGCINYKLSRSGSLKYGFSSLLAVGISTAFVFSLPLMIELIATYCAFGGYPTGSMMSLSIYNAEYIALVKEFFGWKLYLTHEVIYAVLHILWVALFAACLSMFTYALTLCVRLPFHIFYMVPAFLGLEASVIIQRFSGIASLQISYVDYLSMRTMIPYGAIEGVCICMLLLGSSVIITYHKFSGDCIV